MLQALVNWIWKAKRAPIIRKEQRTVGSTLPATFESNERSSISRRVRVSLTLITSKAIHFGQRIRMILGYLNTIVMRTKATRDARWSACIN